MVMDPRRVGSRMPTRTSSRWESLRRRWDRVFRVSFVVSVLLHALVVLLFRQAAAIPDVPSRAAGEDANDARAAAGGGMEIIALRIATPPPVAEVKPKPPTPTPVPVPVPRPVEVKPREPSSVPSALPGVDVSAGEGRGSEAGPGTETGTGRGAGGTGESGLDRIIPPSPRGLILPPSDRPGHVRGKEINVYVFVTERGRVQPDSTRFSPGSGDAKFDNRLKRQAAEWVFTPAQRDGRPVAGWFQYTITL
jgi:outer membrane biosynthesis protein TonB